MARLLLERFLLCVAAAVLLITGSVSTSCSGGGSKVAITGDTIPMRYSSLLTMVECDGYTVVDVENPWNASMMQRYILVPKDSDISTELPEGVVIRTPLESAIIFSGVHAGLFEELGSAECIKGVCDARYVYSEAVVRGLANGAVIDCGSSLDVDVERVLAVNAEAVFVLPYENGGYGKLERVRVPLVECADYMENSALGCAEWVRFYARILGKGVWGDSIFNAVCNEYVSLKSQTSSVDKRPRLMCELKSGSAWYVPGGGSTMGALYADAGADYIFASNNTSGSIPLSYEVMLDKASDADVWLIKYNSPVDMTRASLAADFKGYSYFRPFVEGNVYACNTARKRVFEETAFHPERLLRELVSIFHSGLLPGYEPVYYEKMPE